MRDTDVTLLTVNEVAKILRIGRSSAYELCRQNKFPVVRIGKVIRIPKQALYEWLDRQSQPEEI